MIDLGQEIHKNSAERVSEEDDETSPDIYFHSEGEDIISSIYSYLHDLYTKPLVVLVE
jgi:hypothetical protein